MDFIEESQTRGLLSVAEAARIIDATYRAVGHGLVEASSPSMMAIGATPFRLGAKGAVLNQLDIAGVRLLSRIAPKIMLWSLETGEPIALLDESRMFRFRTGVSAAVVAKYLLPRKPLHRAAIIGAGPIASEMAIAIHQLLDPVEIAIASRSRESAERLVERLKPAPVHAAQGVKDAVNGAELVVTITSAKEVLVRRSDLADGATVLSMGGGLEVDFDVWTGASARYVDDIGYALQQGDAAGWVEAGLLDVAGFKESLTGTVGALAAGDVPGRPDDDALVMAIVQGTTALDIALAHAVYRACAETSESS